MRYPTCRSAAASCVSMLFCTLVAVLANPVGAATRTLDVIAPDAWLPGIPVLVRVEVHDVTGAVDRTLWDAEATLAAAPAGTTLTANRVTLRNGLGSALVRIAAPAGTAEVTLTTSVGTLEAARTLRNLEGEPQTEAKGTLAADVIEWSGIIHVTGALTLPAGGTLRVTPGTLVLVDGVTTDTAGYSIDIKGTLECLGTAERPVTFTARNPDVPWGEVHHDGAAASLYQYTILTRGGNASRGGHTNTGPIIRPTNSKIRFERCSITDTKGKTMTADGADVEFYDCLFSRSAMGPEIGGTALLWERCWAQEFYGADDNDGIYLHGQRAGQRLALRGCVVASGDDDAVDTLGSEVTIEDCILRDFKNPAEDSKGLSVLNGSVTMTGTLIVECKVAVSAKIGDTDDTATVRIDRSTILGTEVALHAYDKYGIDDADIQYHITNTIAHAPDAIYTDYLAADIHVSYSSLSEAWTGVGNITSDPLFVDPAHGDFNLQAASPCIDTGNPAATLDPDGSRADMGCFPFTHEEPPLPRFIRGRVNADTTVDLSDAVTLLLHLFAQRAIACEKAADANDDGMLDIADVVRILDYLFAHADPLPEPAGACGVDPTGDFLDCAAPPCP